jgi:transcription elongation factor Elf1
VGGEFGTCLACGYERDFYASFLRNGKDYRIVLICPNCETRSEAECRIKL